MQDTPEQVLLPHDYPGRLIIVEGIDGSGKSTQIRLLQRWLQSLNYHVVFTEWNSSDVVKATTKKGKKKGTLTPTTYSLLHATDFAHRLLTNILPPLKAGMIVLADRYVYTAYGRDVVRGCDPKWVRKVYAFAPKPDVAFFFRVPADIALARILAARPTLKDYEAGKDLNLHADPFESFKLFQGRILGEYDKMSAAHGFVVMDALKSIQEQQQIVRRVVQDRLSGYEREPMIA